MLLADCQTDLGNAFFREDGDVNRAVALAVDHHIAALSNGIAGFLAGGSFAVILSLAERRTQLEDLSLKRVGAWGALGGLLVVGVVGVVFGASFWGEGFVGALFGAGSASGSVALGRLVTSWHPGARNVGPHVGRTGTGIRVGVN